MALYEQETFGPVVAVCSFRDDAEAITPANASPYGLNAGLWSRSAVRGRARRYPSTSTRPSPPRGAASTRRWAGWATQGSAAATAPPESSSTPSRRPWPPAPARVLPARSNLTRHLGGPRHRHAEAPEGAGAR
ncbi:aldehyde dehydrogenase family protein [Planomonospora venezuelensis]